MKTNLYEEFMPHHEHDPMHKIPETWQWTRALRLLLNREGGIDGEKNRWSNHRCWNFQWDRSKEFKDLLVQLNGSCKDMKNGWFPTSIRIKSSYKRMCQSAGEVTQTLNKATNDRIRHIFTHPNFEPLLVIFWTLKDTNIR